MTISHCLFSLRVSIHAPARGATEMAAAVKELLKFQSTPPRGGRPWGNGSKRINAKFQSTPPRGGRLRIYAARHLRHIVSIHAPARGATLCNSLRQQSEECFNPRPRAGGDAVDGVCEGVLEVSIHAPARGATFRVRLEVAVPDVSIHAPARGATAVEHEVALRLIVSIHAPARGATERMAVGAHA